MGPRGNDDDDLKTRLAALDPERRRRLRARVGVEANWTHPLTSTQTGIWIFEQLHPGTSAYNNPAGATLSGPLDAEALHAALLAVQSSQDALRTRYPYDSEVPFAVVAPDAELPFEFIDVSASLNPVEAARVEALRFAREPFDLETGPVWRVGLARLAERSHVLVVTFHHIISDGWSVGVFFKNLRAAYESVLVGESHTRLTKPSSYAQLMRRKHASVGSARRRALTRHWTDVLSGVEQFVRLPVAKPITQPEHEGATVGIVVPEPLASALDGAAAAMGATPFAALLAAFGALLHIHSGQERIPIIVPLAGRDDPDSQDSIGCFLDAVPVVIDFAARPSIGELVTRARKALFDSIAHSQLPFAEIAAVVSSSRAQMERPVSNVMFVQNNAPFEGGVLGPLTIKRYPIPVVSVKYDWALILGRAPRGYMGEIEYARASFDSSTMERAGADLLALVQAVVSAPDALPLEIAGPG
jgi:hypothetical protein